MLPAQVPEAVQEQDSSSSSKRSRWVWVCCGCARGWRGTATHLGGKFGFTDHRFDMLFHKGGPMVGQSRGYAFITFAQNEGATNALLKLDGTSVGSRSIAVRLAKNIKYDDLQKPKPRIEIPALGTGKREEKISKSEAIRAIEAKLKHLERQTDDNLELNPRDGINANVPFIQRFQFNKDRDNTQRYGKSSAPYHRQQRPKRR
ncbi:probable RNA-binding protein 18 isoform X1 [Drosophila obscura]|uniref:probable RNA-binding protein 18 isoform X1 n=1 Tax=Drosophila obscura TaxID=7282 RepID=UPI001BB0EFD2|nr:probable RNA-binding protein 18 isoform X1 [Drosophila obscura]